MGVTFLNRMGVPVRTSYMQLAGADSTTFGGRGKGKCHLPYLPLTLGHYCVAVTCGPALVDLIPNALLFEGSGSAFFKTGPTPNSRYAVYLIDYERTHETDGRPASADPKEAGSLAAHD